MVTFPTYPAETKTSVNLNEFAKISLTPKGKEVLLNQVHYHIEASAVYADEVGITIWALIKEFGDMFMTNSPNTFIQSLIVRGRELDFNQKTAFVLTENGVSLFKEKLNIEYRTHELIELPLWVLLYALSDIAKTEKPSPIKDNEIHI